MLDVLDAHAVGRPEEDGARVLGVDDRLDADPFPPGLLLVLDGRVDEHREVVEQRPLHRLDVALEQLDVFPADLEPLLAATAREAEALVGGAAASGFGVSSATWSRSYSTGVSPSTSRT